MLNRGLLLGGVVVAVVLLMVAASAAAIVVAVLKHRAPVKIVDSTAAPGTTDNDATADPKKLIDCPPVIFHDDKPTTVVHQVETPAEKPWLSKEEQEKVDKAIKDGLEYLKKQQHDNGGWGNGNGHPVGLAALPGLTLLECGVKPDDPQVVKAANFVRKAVPHLDKTYELSLGILFLDRLGDAADKPLIQTMALRLIAGQTNNGGWSYTCPHLSQPDERELLEILQQTRPARPTEYLTDRPGGSGNPGEIMTRPGGGNTGAIMTRPSGDKGASDGSAPRNDKGAGGIVDTPLPRPGNLKDDKTQPKSPDSKPVSRKDDKTKPAEPKKTLENLSPNLKRIPALQPSDLNVKAMGYDGSDNSNTQFAILAIWVAGRHDVPTEKVGALIDRRFRTSQAKDGGWGYNYDPNYSNRPSAGESPAMTCSGLLGLAVGHGVAAPNPDAKTPAKESVDDEAIKNALKHLSTNLGKSQPPARGRPRGRNQQGTGLYFLWSVERVGVMYNLRSIGDKDWYAWGSEMLVDNQSNEGSWSMGGYFGSTPILDTSFALLFLKRANLAKDLSTKIEYLIDIKGVGNRN